MWKSIYSSFSNNHFAVHLKLTQQCKSTIFQLKYKKILTLKFNFILCSPDTVSEYKHELNYSDSVTFISWSDNPLNLLNKCNASFLML